MFCCVWFWKKSNQCDLELVVVPFSPPFLVVVVSLGLGLGAKTKTKTKTQAKDKINTKTKDNYKQFATHYALRTYAQQRKQKIFSVKKEI